MVFDLCCSPPLNYPIDNQQLGNRLFTDITNNAIQPNSEMEKWSLGVEKNDPCRSKPQKILKRAEI